MKEVRIAVLALASIVPMVVFLWWTDSLDYEDELYKRFRERNEAIVEHHEIERLAYSADRLPHLRQLTIYLKKDDVLSPSLGKLKQVTNLRLVGNGVVEGLAVLEQLPALKELELKNIEHSQLHLFLMPLQQLEALYIEDCNTRELPSNLETFTALKLLSIEDNALNSKVVCSIDWRQLVALQYLNLRRNFLKILPATLLQHPRLVYLDVGHNSIHTAETTDTLIEDVPLRTLRLEHNALTSLPSGLANCWGLRQLNVANNHLDTLPDYLYWRALEDLRLAHNSLTELPTSFEGMDQLRTLTLAHNQLIELPIGVTTLPQLTYLDAAFNGLESFDMADEGWEQLRQLYVEDNRLTGLPKRLLSLPNLDRIAVEGNFMLLEDEWFRLIKSRSWRVEEDDLDFLPAWGTVYY